jgi:hypothetical protein
MTCCQLLYPEREEVVIQDDLEIGRVLDVKTHIVRSRGKRNAMKHPG